MRNFYNLKTIMYYKIYSFYEISIGKIGLNKISLICIYSDIVCIRSIVKSIKYIEENTNELINILIQRIIRFFNITDFFFDNNNSLAIFSFLFNNKSKMIFPQNKP